MSKSLDEMNLLCIGLDLPELRHELQVMDALDHTKFNMIYKDTLESGADYLIRECTVPKQVTIDAILLHLRLPNSRGVNTFKKIKSYCDTLPIVIISDHEDIAHECIKLGAQDYLLKSELTANLLVRSILYAIERRLAAEALEESERKFRNLVELTGAGIYEIDLTTGKFTYVNDVMCKQLGWTKEELLKIGPAGILTEKSMNAWIERWSALDNHDYDGPFEYEIIRKDGSTLWGLIVAEFTDEVGGYATKANVVAIDITKQKLAEIALKKKEKEIFTVLGTKINEWQKELSIRTIKKKQQLALVSGEILSLNNINSGVPK